MLGPIGVLENKHCIAILIFLRERGSCRKTDLYSAVSNNPRMPDKIADLQSIGLVEMVTVDRKTLISLTELGVRVADALMRIQEMLSSSVKKEDGSS